MTLLHAEDLAKSYSGRVVVKALSLKLGTGEVVGLLGPNGAGKTTAFYMVVGLQTPDHGRVVFKGQDVTSLPLHARAQMGMGYLPQEPSVFRDLTVEENIRCILETLDLPRATINERLEALLSELHLKPLAKKKAISLSGGERRRLEITRALVKEPHLLLLDEPFANIDPKTIADVKEMILHLKNKGITVLITDHNAREIFSIADRAYLMRDGELLMEGKPSDLINSEEARLSYLGEDFRL